MELNVFGQIAISLRSLLMRLAPAFGAAILAGAGILWLWPEGEN
jgi:hypothetical protein